MSWPEWLKTGKTCVQYFHMAVTKLGAKLMALEKQALFGMGQSREPTSSPTLWQKIGGGMGRMGSFAMPGLMAFGAVNSIASGENSVGGSLGELGGGLAGYSLGTKAVGALARNMKPGLLKGTLGVLGGMAASVSGSEIGSSIGNAVLPSRRKAGQPGSWLNETADGRDSQFLGV